MKTVKILIATAILSTSFYACKKDEMNIQPGEITLQSSNQSNINAEGTFDASSGIIKIVFNKVGTMIIEGNPNLEKLINMYDASKIAIASANEVFAVTQQETLSITFDRNGNTIASNIPTVPVGSNIDTFINDFCKLAHTNDMFLSITKNNLERNYIEYWNAMPAGSIESFENNIRKIQSNMPDGFKLQIELTPAHSPIITLLNSNGDPQPPVLGCSLNVDSFSSWITYTNCLVEAIGGWN
jgi:hypothetical protein